MLPLDLIELICDYIPKYVMLNHIEQEMKRYCNTKTRTNIIISYLYKNINALQYIAEHYPDKLCYMYWHPGIAPYINIKNKRWYVLNKNLGMIELLEKYPRKILWHILSMNPAAIEMLENNPKRINWNNLIYNKASASLWRKCPNKLKNVDLYEFTKYGPIEIIEENIDMFHQPNFWTNLLTRNDAIELIKKHYQPFKELHSGFIWEIIENANALELIPIIKLVIEHLKSDPNHNYFNKVEQCEFMHDRIKKIICRYSNDKNAIMQIFDNKQDNIDKKRAKYSEYQWELLHNVKMFGMRKTINKTNLIILLKNPGIFKPTKNTQCIDVLLRIL